MASASSILSKLNPATPNLRGISTNYSNDGQKDIGGVGLGDLFELTYDRGEIEKIFNQGTDASYALKQKENQILQNQYANNQFANQQSAVESLRQQRNSQIASGMARGLNAAQEQGTILGIQQQGADGALELANKRQLMADEIAAEYAQNIIKAMQESNAVKQDLAKVSAQMYDADMLGYQTELSAIAQKYAADREYAAQVAAANISAEAQKEIAKYQKETGVDPMAVAKNSTSKAALKATLNSQGAELDDAAIDELWNDKDAIALSYASYKDMLTKVNNKWGWYKPTEATTKKIVNNMLEDYRKNGYLTGTTAKDYGFGFWDAVGLNALPKNFYD